MTPVAVALGVLISKTLKHMCNESKLKISEDRDMVDTNRNVKSLYTIHNDDEAH